MVSSLTRGGGLGPEQVRVIRVGLQVRVGGVFLQQGHLAFPDWWGRARGGVVGGGRGGREGRREQGGGRGRREWATWRMEGQKEGEVGREGWEVGEERVRQNRWQ